MKELRHSLLSILQKFVLTYCKAELAFFFSLSGFPSSNIHSLQDSRVLWRLSLYISFVPLPLASHTFRHWPDYCCRGINLKDLVS